MDNPDTILSIVITNRIALGAVALIWSGLLIAPTGILMRHVPTAPAHNQEFAIGANSTGWRFGMMLAGLSLVFFVLGVIALYLHLLQTMEESLAFVGLLVTIGFLVLFLPVTGIGAYVVPAIGVFARNGQVEMVEIMDQIFKECLMIIPFLSGILWNVGIIILGMAIWRSNTLWQMSGLLMIVYGVLGIPSFLDVKALQIIAPLLGGIAQIAVGFSLWRVVTGG